MFKNILIFTFFLFYQVGFCQLGKIKIQYIEILDENLREELIKYIEENEIKNNLFHNGIGFITISNFESKLTNGRPINDLNFYEPQKSLKINIKAYPLLLKREGNCILCNYFPTFYTFLKNKLILIYEDNIFNLFGRISLNDNDNRKYFTSTSLKKLNKLVKKKALKPLPKNYIFKDFIEEGISYEMLKKKYTKNNQVYNYYEFIEFNASKIIHYNFKLNNWGN